MWTRSFRISGRSQFLRAVLILGVVGLAACSTNGKQRAGADEVSENTAEQEPAPSPDSIAQAQQEMEGSRRELEEQVRRDREELPQREGTLPGGKLHELAREEMAKAVQLCRAAPRRLVEVEVSLDTEGEVQAVDLRTGSGDETCDQAVVGALQASRWVPCQDLGEPAPCRVAYALTLGSPLH